MSLDVWLINLEKTTKQCKECGQSVEVNEELYSANITHNLGEMASKAGIYDALWRPYRLRKEWKKIKELNDYEAEVKFENETKLIAEELIPYLIKGLKKLKERPKYYEKFNSENGWGTYKHFVPFVQKYLNACEKYPEAEVNVSR